MKISPGNSEFAQLEFDSTEKAIIARVVSDTITLLDSRSDSESDDPLAKMVGIEDRERPTDPALLRLLPDADPENPEASAEFRRYTENDIREGKIANLQTILFTLGRTSPADIGRDEAHAWMIGLTDVRLVITSRLGIVTEDDMQQLYDNDDNLDDNVAALLSIYDFLSWMQERFTELFMNQLDGDGR